MQLIYESNKKPVQIGDITTTFRGEIVTVLSITQPHKPSSTGRVIVQFMHDAPHNPCEFFPGVINAVWINREDQPWNN